eukprot:CAMPEP_0178984916 /NCGR_PEP_ID=MMETSP0795-20121207/1876_1 /TAXON_ID=88552 /ORGANISM="Amoebophrya sp., Strain Ameob2" /LENGTH=757 /DNA_ID=CAMNT_0020675843 /DNA_START=235 /DNA_END=2509 /DNA_ORIENTATION=+
MAAAGSSAPTSPEAHPSSTSGTLAEQADLVPVLVKSFGQALDQNFGRKATISSISEKEPIELLQKRRGRAEEKIDSAAGPSKLATNDTTVLGIGLAPPLRPTTSSLLSKEELEAGEEKYFGCYMAETRKRVSRTTEKNDKVDEADDRGRTFEYYGPSLPPLEFSLDVWRQYWRTLEQSDVLLLCADARNPELHVPANIAFPSKKIILVLTKIDLISPKDFVRWRAHFQKRGFASVLPFTKQPHADAETHEAFVSDVNGASARRKRLKMMGGGLMKKAELRERVEGYAVDVYETAVKLAGLPDVVVGDGAPAKKTLTLGCIGHPNVGKSSLLNSLIGSKRLGVSRTAGHTKHIQHIFLDPEADEDSRRKRKPPPVSASASPSFQESGRPATASDKDRGKGNRRKKAAKERTSFDAATSPRRAAVAAGTGSEQNLSKSELKALKNTLRTEYRAEQRGEREQAPPGGRDHEEEGHEAFMASSSKTQNQQRAKKNKRRQGAHLVWVKKEDRDSTPAPPQGVDNAPAPEDPEAAAAAVGENNALSRKIGFALFANNEGKKNRNANNTTKQDVGAQDGADHDDQDPRPDVPHAMKSATTSSPSYQVAEADSARDLQVIVMDCPGLIFPRSSCPRVVYELAGLLPVAQVRETYTAVRFLMEQARLRLDKLYQLDAFFPEDFSSPNAPGDKKGAAGGFKSQENTLDWSPQRILEAFADKKKLILARSGAPDIHRAGLEIIRDCVDGVLCWQIKPPPVPEEADEKN